MLADMSPRIHRSCTQWAPVVPSPRDSADWNSASIASCRCRRNGRAAGDVLVSIPYAAVRCTAKARITPISPIFLFHRQVLGKKRQHRLVEAFGDAAGVSARVNLELIADAETVQFVMERGVPLEQAVHVAHVRGDGGDGLQ